MLIILLLLSDISAPLPSFDARSAWRPAGAGLPHGDWAQNCEARLRTAAHAYSSPEHPEWFDLWWKFRVRKDAIDVRYTASVDICGVYDDFRIRVSQDRGKIQKLHDDGGDFAEFRARFQPVIDACLSASRAERGEVLPRGGAEGLARSGEKDEQDGGEQGRPVTEHARSLRTSRATH